MNLVLNGQDEPRVVFNVQNEDAYEHAVHPSDPRPFLNSPFPTAQYYGKGSVGGGHCLLLNRLSGLGDFVNDKHACTFCENHNLMDTC